MSLAEGCQKGPICIFFDATTKLGTPALVGFIAGQASDQWLSKSKDQIKEAVLIQLESYFGPEVRTQYFGFYLKDWTDEDHLGGGPVNYLPPGQMHNFHQLRTPHGRIHFAGTSAGHLYLVNCTQGLLHFTSKDIHNQVYQGQLQSRTFTP